jgi:hypothetical protein
LCRGSFYALIKYLPLPDHRKLLLISVLVLTALLFIDILLVHEYLPERIPDTPINISGLFLVACIWILFYVIFKRILKQHDTIGVVYLTVFGCLIVLFSEIIFQSYRQIGFTEIIADEDRLRIFLIGVLGVTAFAGMLGFCIAVELKYRKKWLTTLLYVGIGFLFYLASPYILSFIKGE